MGNEDSSVDSDSDDAITLRNDLAVTRAHMGETLDALHGRLNPTVLKEQALDSFHEVKDTIASELKQQFHEAKDAVRAELTEAKVAVRAELTEAKAAMKSELVEAKHDLKDELRSELDELKAKAGDELVEAKAAVREATIGRVEHMVNEAQDKITQTGTSMMDTVKANPLPMALIGAGLAWMYFGGRKSRASKQLGASSTQGMETALESVGHKASDATNAVGGALESAAKQATSFASKSGSAFVSTAHDATTAVSRLAHQAADKTVDLAKSTKDGAVSVQQRTARLFRANPMAFGAAFMAVGTAVGLAIPSSRKEDELMGEARDGILGKAEHMAHDAIGKVGDAAKQFTETSLKTMNSGGKDSETSTKATASAPRDQNKPTTEKPTENGDKKSPFGAPSV